MTCSLTESSVRRRARSVGLAIRKSRCRSLGVPGVGGYMVVDPFHNSIVAGAIPWAFSLSLGEAVEVLEGCCQTKSSPAVQQPSTHDTTAR